MASVAIRRNDIVKVLCGKDRGKEGRVLKVLDSERVIVENVAKLRRHTRPNPGKGIKGGIVEREGTVHVSNVMIICPECAKPTRVRRTRAEDGTRTRTCRRCQGVVERKVEE